MREWKFISIATVPGLEGAFCDQILVLDDQGNIWAQEMDPKTEVNVWERIHSLPRNEAEYNEQFKCD